MGFANTRMGKLIKASGMMLNHMDKVKTHGTTVNSTTGRSIKATLLAKEEKFILMVKSKMVIGSREDLLKEV